jgi:hypothetical protein
LREWKPARVMNWNLNPRAPILHTWDHSITSRDYLLMLGERGISNPVAGPRSPWLLLARNPYTCIHHVDSCAGLPQSKTDLTAGQHWCGPHLFWKLAMSSSLSSFFQLKEGEQLYASSLPARQRQDNMVEHKLWLLYQSSA